MPVYWYYCKSCGIKFSWVFTICNDCKKCVKCGSNKIERVKGFKHKEMLKCVKKK